MIEVKINGQTLEFESGVTVNDVLEAFGDESTEYVFAVKIDGEIFDLDDTITRDCELEPISFRDIRGRQQFSKERDESEDEDATEEQENTKVGAAVGNVLSQDGYSEIENEIKSILGGGFDEGEDDSYLMSDEALMMLESVAQEVINDSYGNMTEEVGIVEDEVEAEEDENDEVEAEFEEDETEEAEAEEDETDEVEAEEVETEQNETEEVKAEEADFDMSVFDRIVPRLDMRVSEMAAAASEELDEMDEADEVDEVDEVDEADEVDEVDEVDEADEVDEVDEAEEVDEVDEVDEAEEVDEVDEVDEAEEYGAFGSFGEFGEFAEEEEDDESDEEPDYSVKDSDFEDFLVRDEKSDEEEELDVDESAFELERKQRQAAALTTAFYNNYYGDQMENGESDDETEATEDLEAQRRAYAHSRRQKRRAKRAIQVAALLIALAGLGWIVGKAALKAVGSSDNTVSGTSMVSDSEAVSATDISESDFMVDGKPQYRAKLLTLGSANELVGMVQIRLSELNYMGEKDINKIYGTKMSKAISQFRAVNKIKGEGDMDKATFDALFSDKAIAAPVSASDAGTVSTEKSTSVTSTTTTEATTQSTTKATTKKTTTTTRRTTTTSRRRTTTTTTTTTRRRTTTTSRRRRTTTTTESTTIEEPTETTTAEEPTASTTAETSSTTKKTTTKKTTTKKTTKKTTKSTTQTTTEPTEAPTSEPTSAPTDAPSSKEENTGSTTDGE